VKRKPLQRALAALVASSLVLGIAAATLARQGVTTRYVYDENGRLQAVVSPTGEAAVYEYDAAGNIKAVRRLAADALALFSFSPHEGMYGDLVTFVGLGFGAGVTGVSFNGAAARVVSATATTVVAEVPEGATTGPAVVTTQAGSVTTAVPFVVRGIRVSPASARVLFGESVQFTALLAPPQSGGELTWSVNGVVGGHETLGTITPSGLYTAPRHTAAVSVVASHTSLPDLAAEAVVRVIDPEDVSETRASAVSVNRGMRAGAELSARTIAVEFGHPTGINNVRGPATSVSYGYVTRSLPLSPSVSVSYGYVTQSLPLSSLLSISYGAAQGHTGASAAVSATTGPHVASLAPAEAASGTTFTLTVTGQNLTGANAVRFLTPSGTADSAFAVSNITVNAEGTQLTANVTLAASAAAGERVVIVTTPAARSLTAAAGSNVLRVLAP
jgi:YD repeat-containing protein